ncbi:MAG TPA: TadE/TadG family type IV pilus assembly protein [Mesorhizobium sp.]|jgi:Flp pilus assembly protein TadG|nr:TadE/TadG family type IV pilus assembly protein [Mesorhizobium sp.]
MRSDTDTFAAPAPRRGPAWRFRRDKRGAVAIEFTLLAIPFCMLVFAILETCIAFASQQVMANATDDVARLLRTGQIKAADMSEDKLKTLICGELSIIASNCKSNILVDLREFPTFALAAKERIKVANGDIDTTGFAVKPGKSMTKNMLRVFYKWPVMTDFMRKSMSNLKDGKTLHFASVTWQNEPFDD